MIEHLRHGDIDKAWWDRQLAQCPGRNWYAQSHVLDAAAPDWEALVDRSTGALMPLTWRRKYGVRYLYQPYGLQQLGVFAPDTGWAGEMLRAVPQEFRYWDICLNASTEAVDLPSARTIPNTDLVLQLAGHAGGHRTGYSENHRRNVRKAEAGGAHFTTAITPAEFTALFARTTAKRFGRTGAHDLATLQRLIETGLAKREIVLAGVRRAGTLHAAICWVHHGDHLILLKSASDEEGQGMKALFHLIDRAIGEAAGAHRVLDFAGSNTPSVARFYAGFGALPTIYLRLVLNRLPLPFRWLKQ